MRAWPFVVTIALWACSDPARAPAPAPNPPVQATKPGATEAAKPTQGKLADTARFRIDRDGPNLLVKPANAECPWLEYAPEGKSLRFRSDRVGCEVVKLSEHERDVIEMVEALGAHMGSTFGPGSLASFGLNQYPELYERVALQALASKRWDKKRGKPVDEAQSINAYVVALAEDPSHYSEVVRIFGPLGYRPRLSSVEKVFVGPPRDTPFAAALRKAGARASDKVPYDSMIGFRLEPK